MKVTAEMILKPGAKLEIIKIDTNSPEFKAQIKTLKKAQKDILDRKRIDPETLRQVITI